MVDLVPRTPKYTFSSTTRTSAPLAVPDATAEWDFMLTAVAIQNATILSDVTDWNTQELHGATALSWGIYWRWATSSEPSSYSFDHASARDAGIMLSIPGVDRTTPIITESSKNQGTLNQAFSAINPGSGVEATVLAFLMMLEAGPDQATVDATNCDSIAAQISSAAASGQNVAVAILQEYLATGGTFTPTYTAVTGELTRSGTISIALKPAEPAEPPPSYFRSMTSEVVLSGGDEITLDPPDGLTSDDAQLVAITHSSGDDPIVDVPAGWTRRLAYTNPHAAGMEGENECIEIFTARGPVGSATFGKSGTVTSMHGIRACYDGGNFSNFVAAPQNESLTRSSSHPIPAQTTTEPDTLLISVVGAEERTLPTVTDWVHPAGWSERYNLTGDEGGDHLQLSLADMLVEDPATVSGDTWTSTSSSWSSNVSFQLVLGPPEAPEGGGNFFHFI